MCMFPQHIKAQGYLVDHLVPFHWVTELGPLYATLITAFSSLFLFGAFLLPLYRSVFLIFGKPLNVIWRLVLTKIGFAFQT